MNLEDRISAKLEFFSKREKILFAISCIERVIELYQVFDQIEDISEVDSSIRKGEGYKKLLSIFEFIKKDLESANQTEIEKKIAECEPLIVDYDVFDTTLVNTVAQLVADSVSQLLMYAVDNDDKRIIYCTTNNLEILNQIKSIDYTSNINPSASGKEVYDSLSPIFEHEIRIEEETINHIKNKKTNGELMEFIQKNKIKYD